MSVREYVFSVDGSPIAAATAGCPASVTSADASWSSDWVLLNGALYYPSGSISVSVDPVGGDVSISDLSVELFDALLPDGKRWVTYYSTRITSRIPSVSVVTDITASSTSFDVASLGVLDTGGGSCWIGAEAIEYGAHATTTIPIVARGAYGSAAVDHRVSEGRYPLAFTEFPDFDRRRCILWKVESGVATALWRGFLEEGPISQDDSKYVVRARALWTRLKERKLGFTQASTRVRGWDLSAVRLQIRTDALASSGNSLRDSFTSGNDTVADTATELANKLQQAIGSALPTGLLNASPNGISPLVIADRNQLTFRVAFRGTHKAGAQIAIVIAGAVAAGANAVDGGAESIATVTVALPPACRQIYVGEAPFGGGSSLTVDTVDGLPSTTTEVSTTVDGFTTSVVPVLRAQWNGSWLVIRPTTTSASPLPTLNNCSTSLLPTRVGPITREQQGVQLVREAQALNAVIYVTEPLSLTLAYRVRSPHWIYALRYAVWGDTVFDLQTPSSPPDYLLAGGRSEDWNWSQCAAIVSATSGIAGQREWFLDGSQTAGALTMDLLRFGGCALTVRADGKLAPWVVRPPLPTDAVAASFVGDDMSERFTPRTERLRNALSNVATLELGDGKLTVVDALSIDRYGQGRTVEVKLHGTDNFAALAVSNSTLAQYLLGRVLWVDPVDQHTLRFPPAQQQQWFAGDYLRVTRHWCLPDGDGNRGYTLNASQIASSARGVMQALSHRVDLGGLGQVEVQTVQWRLDGFAGYSPACRVQSISGAAITVRQSYLSAATSIENYAGVDPAGDGGASKFRAGDRVKLVLRDVTTTVVETGLVVLSVSSTTITCTASVPTSPNNWNTLASTGWVDVIYDDASATGLQDSQRAYAWIGGASVVAGTGDATTRWSP